jgi:hypothetical protein
VAGRLSGQRVAKFMSKIFTVFGPPPAPLPNQECFFMKNNSLDAASLPARVLQYRSCAVQGSVFRLDALRENDMVSAWWLVWAFVMGGYAGMLLIALVVIARKARAGRSVLE